MKEQRLLVKACDQSSVHSLADEFISRISANYRQGMWALADAFAVIAQRGAGEQAFLAVEPIRALSVARKLYTATRREPVLTPTQDKVIRAIGRHVELVSVGMLVHETGLSRGSVNSAGTILIERGLIRREVIQKVSYFELTAGGEPYRLKVPLITAPTLNEGKAHRAPVLLRK
jgi:hypothetical protein